MIVQVMDVSIEGHIEFEAPDMDTVLEFLEGASRRWVDSPDGGGGTVLLDAPYAYVYLGGVDEIDPYPDFIVEHDMIGNYEARRA